MSKLKLLLLLPLLLLANCSPSGGTSGEGAVKKRPSPGCDNLYVDLARGHINGIGPLASPELVNEQFPCATAETEEGVDYNCGGGVFYSNLSMYYYTHADFIEVRRGFAGELDLDLLNKTGEEIIEILGRPDKMDILDTYYYNTKFGCLRLHLHNNKTDIIGIHAVACENVKKCR